jgi:hypothetical protein
MNELAPHKKQLDRAALERSLQHAETTFGGLVAISVRDDAAPGSGGLEAATVSEHDRSPVPVMSLRLVVDDGGADVPEGMVLLARGRAYIASQVTNVVIYRIEAGEDLPDWEEAARPNFTIHQRDAITGPEVEMPGITGPEI